MKKIITSIAALLVMTASASAFDLRGGDRTFNTNIATAKAKAKATAIQGQAQQQTINESDGHRITGFVGVVINSSNNSPCGRVTFGIPSSGANCTAREEAEAIMKALAPSVGQARASRAATWHLCRTDKSMRATLIAAGECRKK